MFRRFVSILVASSMLVTPVAQASVMQGEPGQFFFRYKSSSPAALQPEVPQNKDITAFFVGGVGYAFSEKLPMKADWQDDDWRVVSGTLPPGIVFDGSTQTFSGTPTTEGKGTIVELEGYDATGELVATAVANFDVYTVQGTPVTVDLYAHTGKYRFDTLPIPHGITVDSWRRIYMPPEGIAVNGPYFEGTPTKAGVYPVFIQGVNYMGEVVATYHGKYTVEDGPTFPHIADDVRKLPQLELGYGTLFNFGAPNPHKPARLINPAKQASYYLELATGEELPYGVVSNQVSKNLNLYGYATKPYDTAKIRFKAIDSDATVGYSNWFTIGTSDPQPGCNPSYSGNWPLTVYTGKPASISVPRPVGAQGSVTYDMTSGQFPNGLSLDRLTGKIEGTATTAGEKTDFTVQVDVTNGGNTVSTSCAYRMEVIAGGVRLTDVTAEQLKHIRAGDTYTGTLDVVGGIKPFNVEFKTPTDWPTLTFTSPVQDTEKVAVSGPIDTSGNKTVEFVLKNGDTSSHDGRLTIYSHGPLDIGVIPTIKVQRLGKPQSWGAIPYDATTVIPDVANQGKFPQFTISNPEALPEGVTLDADDFYGTTKAEVGVKGPFTVTMTDFSGETKQSNPFNIEITAREPISGDNSNGPALNPPVFTVERDVSQTATPFRVTQPYGAADFQITWTLNGGPLPSWLTFDQTTGTMSATANIPFADIGTYGPFTVTATDEEGSAITSEEFQVTAQDWPAPAAASVAAVQSNVSGDPSAGETQTYINIANLKNYVLRDTVIGGPAAVKLLSAEPSKPAGLTFDADNGTLFGVPTSEFNGTVAIEFEDARGRNGTINVPLTVKPYPTIAMEASSYELPRLSQAQTSDTLIAAKELEGFWHSARFEWDSKSTPLPDGLTVSTDGTIMGRTNAPVGTVTSGIRLMARSSSPDGTALVAYTAPFSIAVVAPKPMMLAYSPNKATYRFDGSAGSYTLASKTSADPQISGSYVTPLTYTLDQSEAVANGMTGTLGINASNGTITGMPDRLGEWTVHVSVRDAEGSTVASPVAITIKTTLAGYIGRTGGSSGGGDLTLRQGEPFKTAPFGITKYVGTPVFSTTPAALSPSPVFDATTGVFTDEGAFEQPLSNYVVYIDVKDDDGRTLHPGERPSYRFNVLPPLEVSTATRSISTRQYSAAKGDPIDVSFSPSLNNKIGNIRYALSGDLPGTLATMVYDDAGTFLHYAYTDAYGVDHQEPDASKLPLDALVFDTIAATLKGIPSQAGTFGGIRLVASDDHQKNYIRSVASQKANNTATSGEITITVAPAADLVVANKLGQTDANSETIYQYTSVPALKSVATNAAYGKPVTWSSVSGHLPQGIQSVKGTELTYTGYPEVVGNFGDIAWQAKDAAGRTASSDAATFKVDARKELELVATNPIGLVVNDTVADVAVTPRFSAYGRPIPKADWTVTGVSNIPPGIAYSIEDNRVVFTGTATVIGTYKDIVVAAVDSLGSSASVNLTFNVILPSDAIILNVSDIKTKVGIPFEMQATSSNTYGSVRYYSYDITGALADQLKLNTATGLASGIFTSVQNLDFDVYVSDETNRITTKPVRAQVMPSVRVTVPQLVEFEPNLVQQQTVATDYVLGTVAYEQANPADWPAGLSVDPATGTLKSDGTTPIGEYADLVIAVTDSFDSVGQTFADRGKSNPFTVKIDTNGPYVALKGGNLDPWSKRKSGYSQDLSNEAFLSFKNIGLGEIAFTIPTQPTGKRAPPGLSISSAGLLIGTPTESGDFEFNIQAAYKSNANVKSVATYRMHIDLLPLTLELEDSTLPDAESGKAYSFDFKPLLNAINVPTTSLSWTKTDVDNARPLPSGLSLSNGVLSGTPTGADEYEFKIKAAFTNNNPAVEKIDAEKTYRLYVKKAAPYFSGTIANVSKAVQQSITVTPNVGNKHSADVYELVGNYPAGLFLEGTAAPGDTAPGLVFDTTTGVISGATKLAGDFPVQIKVTDKLGQSAVSNLFNIKFLNTVPSFVGEFTNKTDVERNIYYVSSNPILISGNTAPAPTTLTMAQSAFFRICTSTQEAQTGLCSTGNTLSSANVASGTYLQVFLMSAPTFDTTYKVTLSVGGVIREFSVSTRTSVTTPTNLGKFEPITGAERSLTYSSNIIKVEGLTDDVVAKVQSIEGGAGVLWVCKPGFEATGDCSNSNRGNPATSTISIKNGAYVQLTAATINAFNATTRVALTIGTEVRDFSVTTRNSVTTPTNLGEFAPITNAERSLTYASNIIKVEGITDSVTATVASLEGGAVYLWACKPGFEATGDCSNSNRGTSTINSISIANGTYVQLTAATTNAFNATTRGRLTIGSEVREFSVTTRSRVTTPTNLGQFTPIVGAERSLTYTSNIIKVEGVTDGTVATATQLEGGSVTLWVCKPGYETTGDCASTTRGTYGGSQSVTNGSYIQMAVVSPGAFNAVSRASLAVGEEVREFSVTTRASATDLGGAISFEDSLNVERSTYVASNAIQIKGLPGASPAQISIVEGSTTYAFAFVCSTPSAAAARICNTSGNFKANFNAAAGNTYSANNGDYIQLAILSPSVFDSAVKVKVTINGEEKFWTIKTRKINTTPSNLGQFATELNVERARMIYSNAVRVDGISDATPLALGVTAGTAHASDRVYICASAAAASAKNCYNSFRTYGAIGGTPTVNPGEYVQLATLSENTFDAEKTLSLSIGGVVRTFTTTTRPTDIVPENLGEFAPETNVELSRTVYSNAIRVDGITDATTATVSVVGTVSLNSDRLYVCASAAAASGKTCYNTLRTYAGNGGTIIINPGEYIQVGSMSENAFDTEKTVVIKFGEIERRFIVKTRTSNTTPVNLPEFTPVAEKEANVRIPSNVIKVSGITDATSAKLERIDNVLNNGDATLYVCSTNAAMTGDCYSNAANYTLAQAATNTNVSIPPNSSIQLVVKSASTLDTNARVKLTVGGIERLFDVKTRALDTTPENLGTFTTITNAKASTTVMSEPIRVADIKDATQASITVSGAANADTKAFSCSGTSGTNGSCAVNYYAIATASGAPISVLNEQYVVLQTKAAATPGAEVVVTLNVGGVLRTWTVRTAAQ